MMPIRPSQEDLPALRRRAKTEDCPRKARGEIMADKADIGILGLAVMGANLARNAAHHGFGVAVFNRNHERTDELIAKHGGEGRFLPGKSLSEFVASIAKPRPILIMVKAGPPVD